MSDKGRLRKRSLRAERDSNKFVHTLSPDLGSGESADWQPAVAWAKGTPFARFQNRLSQKGRLCGDNPPLGKWHQTTYIILQRPTTSDGMITVFVNNSTVVNSRYPLNPLVKGVILTNLPPSQFPYATGKNAL